MRTLSLPSVLEQPKEHHHFHHKLLPAMSRTFSISNALKNPTNVAILRRHGVIYVDRGLIALNKKPGLVTQGTTNSHKKVECELFRMRVGDSDSTCRRGRYKSSWMVRLCTAVSTSL